VTTLNEHAWAIADDVERQAATLRVNVERVAGARVLDLGVQAEGGMAAGLALARVCLAGLGEVAIVPYALNGQARPHVQVMTDQPVRACMASQYAGWQVSAGKFFAMGSGPMRAAYGNEALFADIDGKEAAPCAVGVLETRKLPDEAVICYLCEKLELPAEKLTLLVAPAASQAGTLQVVARSVETALHKLHELEFDLKQVRTGWGLAPLPAVAGDEIGAIGRTNDAILYGGRVVLWVRADDADIERVGPKVPSSASADHGAPFAELFERYNRDFYKIDPLLFSPAVVVFHNLKTGRSHSFGNEEPGVLARAWG
jgi:methenyltetrahydromethanopterin cyclohydrolase